MAVLLLAEHDNGSLAPATGKAITAARAFGGDVDVLVVGEEQGRHQITPASFFSLATSSSTEVTLAPALRPGGSVVLSTFRRGETSTP